LSPYDSEIESLWRAIDAVGAHSVAVVSSLQGEGTTLIACALARRAGLTGTPSLLVDLSQSHSWMSDLLDLAPQPGEIVTLRDYDLAVLANVAPEDASAWREPSALAAQATRWAADWGLVVFDTTPLLARNEESIPAKAIASAAQATILVVLAGRTPVPVIREARARLDGAGARLIGTVMNDRDNPSLLAELERESYRLERFLPRPMAALRSRLRRAALFSVRT
jgi:Mrp family chromosome partitioning ATPase